MIVRESYKVLRERIYLDYLSKNKGSWEEMYDLLNSKKYYDNK